MKKLEIGRFVTERRKSLHVSQGELAKICGISEHALGNFERGAGNPTFDLMKNVLDALGLEFSLQVKQLER